MQHKDSSMETTSETEVKNTEPVISQLRGETGTLVYKRDRFIVREGDKWIYYLTRATPTETNKFVDFLKSPPVYKDGFFAYDRKFYPVSKRDVVRGHFLNNSDYAFTLEQLKSIYEPTNTTEANVNPSSCQSGSDNAPAAGEDPNQPGFRVAIEEEANDIDLAWDEQIRTLLTFQDPEEEWDI